MTTLPSLGPLMIDVAGHQLSAEDRELLAHPLVAGVVLFSRNFVNSCQLRALVQSIRDCRPEPLLVSVDHEGGRVQRFRQGFTTIPAMRHYGTLYQRDAVTACDQLRSAAWLMATELAAHGIDFSFAPVLDIDRNLCAAIGDRALHSDAAAVTALGKAAIEGLQQAGFCAVLKHFPGHGGVQIDSHAALPVDNRSKIELATDMAPFKALCLGQRTAVMPSHVVYSGFDERPASLSQYWLKNVLRDQWQFRGAVISDDLHMGAATEYAGPHDAACLAQQAGCDLLLICNDRQAVEQVLCGAKLAAAEPESLQRRLSLRVRSSGQPKGYNVASIQQDIARLLSQQT